MSINRQVTETCTVLCLTKIIHHSQFQLLGQRNRRQIDSSLFIYDIDFGLTVIAQLTNQFFVILSNSIAACNREITGCFFADPLPPLHRGTWKGHEVSERLAYASGWKANYLLGK